jgi:predicted ATPase
LTQSVSEDSYVKDVLSTNYYRYKLDIENNGDKFSEMSEGKKAFVILKLLLDFSDDTCPILIDQPEDELDNRSIYNELSKYLREKKSKRQVIVVTHNPNIVVGADAEEVIVANQHGVGTENKNEVKFDYKTGSLENTYTNPDTENTLDKMGIKEHVCDILEGGKEAFEKRENKFGRS